MPGPNLWQENSYPTSQPRQQQHIVNQTRNINSLNSKPNPRNSHGIRLRPVSDLRAFASRHFRKVINMHTFIMTIADIYRSIFKFGVFNAVQSQCFDEVRSCILRTLTII